MDRSGDPDTYRTFLDDSSVAIHLQTTKDPQERKDRVRADMTWYARAPSYSTRVDLHHGEGRCCAPTCVVELLISLRGRGITRRYGNAKQGLGNLFWGCSSTNRWICHPTIASSTSVISFPP